MVKSGIYIVGNVWVVGRLSHFVIAKRLSALRGHQKITMRYQHSHGNNVFQIHPFFTPMSNFLSRNILQLLHDPLSPSIIYDKPPSTFLRSNLGLWAKPELSCRSASCSKTKFFQFPNKLEPRRSHIQLLNLKRSVFKYKIVTAYMEY